MAQIRLVFEFEEDRKAQEYYNDMVRTINEEYTDGVRLYGITIECSKHIGG